MGVTNKKKDIILALQLTNDQQLIEEVYELLHPGAAMEEADLKELPEDLKEKIDRALSDYKNGKYISHEQMKQKVQQWLLK